MLVGDIYQIESIRYGNWFGIIPSFIPSESVFELTTPYRTSNKALVNFWSKVRNIDDDIAEVIVKNKAQGLEYDSVKIVITDANEEDITHNIFYTAITRARDRLQIFWTPETQQKVLQNLRHNANSKDIALLKSRRGLVSVNG